MMILNTLKNLKMRKKLIYIVCLIGFIGFAQENPVSIETDTTTIKIGEQIQFKIGVNETNNVVFPKLALDSLGKVEVIESLPVDTLKNRLEKKYLLTSFDSGQYVLPKQLVLINNKQFYTDSLLVNVATVKVDTLKQKMFPIKSIKKEPKTFDDYKHLLWWLIPILVLLAVVLYVVFRKKVKKAAPKVYVAPIKEALQRLKELDEKQLVQQNKIKIYYSELTDIVRTYIEKDIKIPALESTTNELIETINDFNESSNLGISKETIHQLKEVLQTADLVKFAKSKPIVNEIKNDRTVVEEILNNTQNAVHINEVEDEKELINEEIFNQEVLVKKNFNFKKYSLIFVAVLVIVIIGYLGYKYIKESPKNNSFTEMLDEKWKSSNYGNPSISLETPEVLEAKSVIIPDDLKLIINETTTHNYGSMLGSFYIEATVTSFINELQNFNFDDAIQGTLNQIAKKYEINFNNLQQDIRVNNGIEGRLITADYNLINNKTQEMDNNKFTMLLFAEEKNIRQVIITQLASDEKAEEVNERILKSVSLNP